MKIYASLILIFSFGCTSINQSSREHYQAEHKMRHGIVPRETAPSKEKWDKIFTQSNIAAGKKVYQSNCVDCHGSGGLGDGPKAKGMLPPPQDLTKLSKEVPNFQFYMMISKWQGDMPGWKKPFTAEEIEQLEAYIHSLAANRQ